jgi:hypothetical protein
VRLLSDSKDKVTPEEFVEYLNSDSVESLKMQLKNARLMFMAIMDQMDTTEITISTGTLLNVTGSIETHYDFSADGYVFRRVKE